MFRSARTVLIASVCGVLGLAGGWTLHAQTSPDTLDPASLPPAVRRTVDQFSEGGKISKAAKAKEDGLPVYKVDVDAAGRKIEIQTTMEGRLFSTEEKIATGSLPPDVLARAKSLFADESTIHAERAIVGAYEVSGDVKGKRRSYLVNEAGVAFRESKPGIQEAPKEKSKDKPASDSTKPKHE
jgi:hypothetical protein